MPHDSDEKEREYRKGQEKPLYTNTDYPVVLQRRGVILSNQFVISLTNLFTSYLFYGEENEDVGLRQRIMI